MRCVCGGRLAVRSDSGGDVVWLILEKRLQNSSFLSWALKAEQEFARDTETVRGNLNSRYRGLTRLSG